MAYNYRSSVESVGKDLDPDIVYYNADIVADAFSPASLGLDKDPVIRFQETRSIPLLNDISKYMFSIIRFTMDGAGKDLPIFIPSINDTQPDINLTDYSVSMVYTVYYKNPVSGANEEKTFTAQRFIYYQPETVNAPIPQPPNTVLKDGTYVGQDLRGRYYWVYTYDHWTNLCNKALADLFYDPPPTTLTHAEWDAHQVASQPNPRLRKPFPTYVPPTLSIREQWKAYWLSIGGTADNLMALQGTPPFLRYNQDTGLFSMFGDSYCFGDNLTGVPVSTPPKATDFTAWSWNNGTPVYGVGSATVPTQGTEVAQLYFNTNMFGLFANFNNLYYGDELPSGLTNKIMFQPTGSNLEVLSSTSAWSATVGGRASVEALPSPYIKITQNYNSTSTLWSPISAIVFSSTMIPIFPEQTGTPLSYGEGNTNAPQESTSAFAPIITDISIPMERADDYRGFLSYTPTGEYRLSSFTGSRTELRNIDIQVFWKNRINNQLYPITMFNLTSVSIKMMFRKK
jgi:hypothetical protein